MYVYVYVYHHTLPFEIPLYCVLLTRRVVLSWELIGVVSRATRDDDFVYLVATRSQSICHACHAPHISPGPHSVHL